MKSEAMKAAAWQEREESPTGHFTAGRKEVLPLLLKCSHLVELMYRSRKGPISSMMCMAHTTAGRFPASRYHAW